AERISILFGVVAFLLTAVASTRVAINRSLWAAIFLRSNPLGAFWVAFYAFLFPAVLCIAARCWYADRAERRRVLMFGAATAVGTAPIVVAGIVQVTSPAYRALMLQHGVLPRIVDAIVWVGLFSIPITTALSVSLRGALPIRRLAATALAFVLARN